MIWRLDADATIDKPMKKEDNNFLREMWGKKKKFGYWCRLPDKDECDSGIREATDLFAKKKYERNNKRRKEKKEKEDKERKAKRRREESKGEGREEEKERRKERKH